MQCMILVPTAASNPQDTWPQDCKCYKQKRSGLCLTCQFIMLCCYGTPIWWQKKTRCYYEPLIATHLPSFIYCICKNTLSWRVTDFDQVDQIILLVLSKSRENLYVAENYAKLGFLLDLPLLSVLSVPHFEMHCPPYWACWLYTC